MKVSYYNTEEHEGGQPVRVLSQNTKKWFKEVYPNFENTELKKAIEEFGLYEEISIIEREDKIATPAFVGSFKIIQIQETYLSLLWCLSYSLTFLYDKSIHEPRTKENFIFTVKLNEQIKKAHDLFDYGLSIIDTFNPWDKENLPNPEFYDANEDEYIEKANGVYLHAVNFVLVHELGHVLLGHIDSDIKNDEKGVKISNEIILQDEIDADNFSFERMFKSTKHLTNDHTASVGLISALCSFIFFSNSMNGGDHPDPDLRLQTALEKLNLEDEDNLWGLSCLAIKLWSNKHRIAINWPNKVETYKDLFYLTMEQLNNLKSAEG